jgi:glutaredoxin 2
MTMKLYVYDHCPYCNRVRFLAGLKHIALDIVHLSYADNETTVALVGKRAVPILQQDDGSLMLESMDIAHYLDAHSGTPWLSDSGTPAVEDWLTRLNLSLQTLTYPLWLVSGSSEFQSEAAKLEWVQRKGPLIGGFEHSAESIAGHKQAVNGLLQEAEQLLDGRLDADRSINADELKMFTVLRNLCLVEGLQWPTALRQWLQRRSEQSGMALYSVLPVKA